MLNLHFNVDSHIQRFTLNVVGKVPKWLRLQFIWPLSFVVFTYRYFVKSLTPAFLVCVRSSPFCRNYLQGKKVHQLKWLSQAVGARPAWSPLFSSVWNPVHLNLLDTLSFCYPGDSPSSHYGGRVTADFPEMQPLWSECWAPTGLHLLLIENSMP